MHVYVCRSVCRSVCRYSVQARYLFDTDIDHLDIYAKSPYFKGVELWNLLPIDIQNINDGFVFRNSIKRHLDIFLLL